MLGKYYKAIIAGVGVLGFGIASLSASTDFQAVLPTAGSGWLVGAGTVVTGIVAFLVRNKKTVDQVDTAIESGDFTISDLKNLIRKWDAPR